MAHLPKIIFSLCFLLLICMGRSAQAQDEISKFKSELIVLQQRIKTLYSKIDSAEAAILAAKPSDERTPRVTIGPDVGIFPSAGSVNLVLRTVGRLSGVLDDARRARVHFVGDKGVSGWISSSSFDFESDGSVFILLLESKPGLSPIVLSDTREANARYYAPIIAARKKEEEAERIRKDEAALARARELAVATAARKKEEEAELAVATAARKKEEEAERIRKDEAALARARVKENKRINDLRSAGIFLELDIFTWTQNSASGVEPIIQFHNRSLKDIKYTTIESRVFNPVGDPADSEHGAQTNLMKLRLVGPIKQNQQGYYAIDSPRFYSSVASCIEVRKIVVEYMDGSTRTMVNDLKTMRKSKSDFKIRGECAVN
jgi:cell division septum initiation protein DivIVA